MSRSVAGGAASGIALQYLLWSWFLPIFVIGYVHGWEDPWGKFMMLLGGIPMILMFIGRIFIIIEMGVSIAEAGTGANWVPPAHYFFGILLSFIISGGLAYFIMGPWLFFILGCQNWLWTGSTDSPVAGPICYVVYWPSWFQ